MKMLWNRKEVFFLSRDANSSLKKVSAAEKVHPTPSPSHPASSFTSSHFLEAEEGEPRGKQEQANNGMNSPNGRGRVFFFCRGDFLFSTITSFRNSLSCPCL
jgi:hypothetical protein